MSNTNKKNSLSLKKENDSSDDQKTANVALDEVDIQLLKSYGLGAYTLSIKNTEKYLDKHIKEINNLAGFHENDTGLAHPSFWDLVTDRQMMQQEQPLQVARVIKIINTDEDKKYLYKGYNKLLNLL